MRKGSKQLTANKTMIEILKYKTLELNLVLVYQTPALRIKKIFSKLK